MASKTSPSDRSPRDMCSRIAEMASLMSLRRCSSTATHRAGQPLHALTGLADRQVELKARRGDKRGERRNGRLPASRFVDTHHALRDAGPQRELRLGQACGRPGLTEQASCRHVSHDHTIADCAWLQNVSGGLGMLSATA